MVGARLVLAAGWLAAGGFAFMVFRFAHRLMTACEDREGYEEARI